MRVLMLVIASRTERAHERLLVDAWVPYIRWASTAHSWLTVKLVVGSDTSLEGLESVTDSVFVSRHQDGYGMPVFRKTIDALRVSLPQGKYDYVVRTNLSSWLDPAAMCSWLHESPTHGLYAGRMLLSPAYGLSAGHWAITCHVRALCGALIVLSPDAVAALLAGADEVMAREDENLPDDWAIGTVLHGSYTATVIPPAASHHTSLESAGGFWTRLKPLRERGDEVRTFLCLLGLASMRRAGTNKTSPPP
jgi:hypothetical protein